ncbi:cytochrome P450 family protein [Ceratobasidium sp. AG-Ba]|nr:cytochrome P450 family protein [Ceratobasidium sp. AG-Ba]
MKSSFPLYFEAHHPGVVATITSLPVVAGTTAALGAALAWYLFTTNDDSQIKKIRGWPVVGQWSFFTKRHDFVMEGFRRTPGESMFSFNIFQHNVVVLRGEEARKEFFDRRDLNFTEGYRLLFGGVPEIKDVVQEYIEEDDQAQISSFIRRLSPLLRTDRLAALTPLFMSDLERNMARWGLAGKFDPFEDIYSMVFQLTIRAAACREIADSVESCKRMEKLYWMVEKGSTPTSLLLPWLPSMSLKLKWEATLEMYRWLDDIIKARQAENRREEDALQDLLDMGDSTTDIIQFVMGTLFTGILNSGLMSVWIFILLDQEPQWKAKVVAEIKSLLDKHAPISQGYSSVAERLSDIPPEAWEGEMPVLEVCLRETIRLVSPLACLRRVTKGDLDVEGKKVPNGSFLVYLSGETHSNPDIYPEPSRFNPDRFAEGQDKSQYHAFLGWGVGRHPCSGRRFAQYEIKSICAMFLSQYDYEVVNSKGVHPDPSTTIPDRNDLYQARPKDEKFYIKYTKRQQPF